MRAGIRIISHMSMQSSQHIVSLAILSFILSVCLFQCWFGRNLTCDQRGRWSTSYTTMGVCHTFALSEYI